jgi:hypothetical protein
MTIGLVLLLAASIGCATAVQRRTDAFFDLAGTGRDGVSTVTALHPAPPHSHTHRHWHL